MSTLELRAEQVSHATNRAEQVCIGGIRLDSLTFEQVADLILDRALRADAGGYVVTPNAQLVSLFQDNQDFRDACERAWLRVADGVPLVWASRLLGNPLPGRVNGTDLMERLAERSATLRLRIFLLGGAPGSADEAARVLSARYPGLLVAGTHCPPRGFERNEVEIARVDQAIRRAAPHLVFVGLGAPKQELWMQKNSKRLNVAVSLGIGGSFELISGRLPRAPLWMQRAGLEWLFRLYREPRRLWRRYFVTNPRFIALIIRQYLRERSRRP